ncbi:MAG: tetratricopeptide repeat protein, partial [Acidobacteriota bacterium]
MRTAKLSTFFLMLAFSLSPMAVRLHAQQVEMRELTPGATIEREMAGGEAHTYRVKLSAGQFIRIITTQKGIDVVCFLFNPVGEKIVEIDSPNGTQGPEMISAVAETPGDYRLEVRSLSKGAPAGRYDLKIAILREATTQDRSQAQAEKIFAEAEALRLAGSASWPAAISKYEEARPHWRTAGDQAGEVKLLTTLATLHGSQGNKQKAIDHLNQAAQIAATLNDQRQAADSLSNIADVYKGRLNELQKAFDIYTQALNVYSASGNRAAEADTLLSICHTYEQMGRYEEALKYCLQVMPIVQTLGNRRMEAVSHNLTGMIYLWTGDYQQSLDHTLQHLAIARALDNHSSERTALHNQAYYYKSVGDYPKAIEIYDQAIALAKKYGDRSGDAYSTHNQGWAYILMGDYQKGIELNLYAVPIFRELRDRRGGGYNLYNLGLAYRLSGNAQEAIKYTTQAVEFFRTGERRGLAETLGELGMDYALAGDHQKAIAAFGEALELWQSVNDPSSEAYTRLGMARVERARGNINEARTQLDTALARIEAVRTKAGANQMRSAYLASKQEYYEELIDLLMQQHKTQATAGYAAAALQVSERARARSMLETLGETRADIREGVAPQLIERERAIQQQINTK